MGPVWRAVPLLPSQMLLLPPIPALTLGCVFGGILVVSSWLTANWVSTSSPPYPHLLAFLSSVVGLILRL